MSTTARFAAILLGILTVSLAGGLSAETPRVSEYQVKAAFLYNFTKFVEWPSQALNGRDSLEICIFGGNPFGTMLEEAVTDQTAHGRPIAIRYTEKPEEARSCHVLYIATADGDRARSVLDATTSKPILTVGDAPGFASNGGMIGFYLADNKVRFEINRDTAEDAGLLLSSRLLKLARLVDEGE